MAKIEESTVDSSSSSTFDADLRKAARNSSSSDWDSSSLYQVKNFVTYSCNEKNDMFEYLCLHLCTLNTEKLVLKNQIKSLKENILDTDKQMIQMKTLISNLSLTNKFIHTEKDKAIENSDKLQRIMNNWAHSHNKLNKIISDQIPDQCAKIIGGQIDEAVAKFEQIKTEQNFPTSAELASDFKTRFVSNSSINQNLINKHCVTDPHGFTTCVTRLTALDPTIRNHADKYPVPTTECYLKFPISNGEVHSTKENLANLPDCSVMAITANESSSHLTSDPPSTAAHTHTHPHTPSAYSTPSSQTFSTRKKPCRSKSPNQSPTYYTLKVCYRCGDSSHKISDCTLDVNSRRSRKHLVSRQRMFQHMTGSKALLSDFVKQDGPAVTYGDNSKGKTKGFGTIKCKSVEFKNVSYVKGLQHNLISISQICDADYEVHFNKREGKIINKSAEPVLTANRKNDIYVLEMFSADDALRHCFFTRSQPHLNWLWHKKLSHINFKALSNLSGNQLVRGIPKMKVQREKLCSACVQGKQTKASFKSRSCFSIADPFHLLHVDLFGPVPIKSRSGRRFTLVIVDDVSQNFSAVRTPQQNGVAERRNRTLIEAGCTMLVEAGLPLSIWAEAVNTACYTQNRSIIVKRHGKTAYEMLKGRSPDVSYFHVFGCVCYILNQRDPRSKFEPKADEGIFLGYSSESKAYRVFNSKSQSIEELAHVKIDDDSYPSSRIDHPAHVLHELTLCPSDEPSEDLLEPIVPDITPSADEPLPVTAEAFIDDQNNDAVQNNEAVPNDEAEAMQHAEWIQAMQDELLEFKRHNIWTLVPRPNGKTIIGTRWVYRNKEDKDGIIIRNKARLVAQGFTQIQDLDYGETFAPVARIEAIRLFLAYASFKGVKVYQMDVKTAFLYGNLEEEVFLKQPPGFESSEFPDHVYRLDKAVYGLKQAPRAWYDTLASYLLSNGYSRGAIDKMLFTKKSNSHLILVQIYVDDIIFGSTNEHLSQEFADIIKYVAEILKKYSFTDCKVAHTPMSTSNKVSADPIGTSVNPSNYRGMIGSLLYLTASRPDIMFATSMCARYQADPKESHLAALKRIFRYLKGTPALRIWYPHDSPFDLIGYTDADHAGCPIDRKSTSGGCLFLGHRLIRWYSKKQVSVAISSTEAEYIATGRCCAQILWIQNQLLDYGYKFTNTPIFCDNTSAISITKNPVQHTKTKHIEIRFHFLRDNAEKGMISIHFVPSPEQLADLLTKAVDRATTDRLIHELGMIEIE
ncbi:hypothetical protein LXL04_020621 [Taraxacum kok-saghyz]